MVCIFLKAYRGRVGLHISLSSVSMLICFADHFFNYWTISVKQRDKWNKNQV